MTSRDPHPVSVLLIENGHRGHDLFAAAIRAKGWRLSLAVAALDLGEQVRWFAPDVVLVVSGGEAPRADRALVDELQLLPKAARTPLVIIRDEEADSASTASKAGSSDPALANTAERLVAAVERAVLIARVLVGQRRLRRRPEHRPKPSPGHPSTLH